MEIYNDAYTEKFDSFESMLDFCISYNNTGFKVTVPARGLEIQSADDLIYYEDFIEEEAIIETRNGINLAVTVPYMALDGSVQKFAFPLRDKAYKSLLDRCGISGQCLKRLSSMNLAGVLNSCIKVSPGNVFVICRGSKCEALLSGDERDYKDIGPEEILMYLSETLTSEGGVRAKFKEGFWSHSFIKMFYLLENDSMEEGDFGVHKPALEITTSEIGLASLSVKPVLFNTLDETYLPIGGSVSRIHRYRDLLPLFKGSFEDLADGYFAVAKQLMIPAYSMEDAEEVIKKSFEKIKTFKEVDKSKILAELSNSCGDDELLRGIDIINLLLVAYRRHRSKKDTDTTCHRIYEDVAKFSASLIK